MIEQYDSDDAKWHHPPQSVFIRNPACGSAVDEKSRLWARGAKRTVGGGGDAFKGFGEVGADEKLPYGTWTILCTLNWSKERHHTWAKTLMEEVHRHGEMLARCFPRIRPQFSKTVDVRASWETCGVSR